MSYKWYYMILCNNTNNNNISLPTSRTISSLNYGEGKQNYSIINGSKLNHIYIINHHFRY